MGHMGLGSQESAVSKDRYVPALRFRWLTALYDPLMERWTAAKPIREAVLRALDLRPGLRLLELGCGPGRLAIEIKQRHSDVTIDAVDGDPEILEVAERNAAAAGAKISFRQADITRLAVTGTYDRVYSTLVFHHLSLAGKLQALDRVRRALAPGGTFVIADFGRPDGAVQWVLFSIAGWADGAANTYSHRDGRFEQAIRDRFSSVSRVGAWRTVFGTIEAFVCRS